MVSVTLTGNRTERQAAGGPPRGGAPPPRDQGSGTGQVVPEQVIRPSIDGETVTTAVR